MPDRIIETASDQPTRSARCRFRALPFWLPALIPPLLVAWLIAHWQVNSWLVDDWMLADLMDKASKGTLAVGDFTAVQMEHRLVLPRLIAVPALLLTHGDLRILNWIAWTLQCVTLAAILKMLQMRAGGRRRGLMAVSFLISAALFSTVQWQSFLWPICFTIQLPLALLSVALLALGFRSWNPWLRLSLAWPAVAGGALSFASGLPGFLTVPAAVACGLGGMDRRKRGIFCGIWALLTAVFFILYFHDFKNRADPDHSFRQGETVVVDSHLAIFLSHPGKSLHFFLTTLGGPFARGLYADPRVAAPVIGALLTVSAAWFSWILLRLWRKEPGIREQSLPFVVLTAFGIGTSLMVSMGRVWVNTNSVTPGMMDRYATYGLTALTGLMAWGWLVRQNPACRKRWRWPGAGRLWRGAGLVVTILLVMNWAYGSRVMSEWSSARGRALAGTLFLNVLPVTGLEDNVASLKRWANQLNDHGFLRPALLKNLRLDQFKIRPLKPLPPPTATVARNRVTSLAWRRLPDGRLVLHTEGVARLTTERTADMILMTWRNADSPVPLISGVHLPDGPPFWLYKTSQIDWMYVHHRFGRIQDSFATFSWDAPVDKLPEGEINLQVWMLNVQRMEATPLGAPLPVRVDKALHPSGDILTEALW